MSMNPSALLSSLLLSQEGFTEPPASGGGRSRHRCRLQLQPAGGWRQLHSRQRFNDRDGLVSGTAQRLAEGTPVLRSTQTLVVAGATASFQETPMDLVLVLVTVGFFALAWGYTHGCERL
jgi:hypothetical protein